MKAMSVPTAIGLVILAIIFFSSVANAFTDFDKYKFLFRNTIYSDTLDLYPVRKAIYEMAPVMRGKVSRPNYFFLPERNQYLVGSSIRLPDLTKVEMDRLSGPRPSHRYVLLDGAGQLLRSFDTDINFSRFSGKFFSPTHYIDWLDSGSSAPIAYEHIFNQDLTMDQTAFMQHYRELYHKAEYSENIDVSNGTYYAAAVFNIQGKWSILLSGSGLNNSHMYSSWKAENPRTAISDRVHGVVLTYKDPEGQQKNPFPPSPPSMQLVPLETEIADPYLHTNIVGRSEFFVDKYSTGRDNAAQLKGEPVYISGESFGVAYVRLKLDKDRFYFKVPSVQKSFVLPLYNLGLRLFKLPESLRSKSSLVFMESTQNTSSGGIDRPGLGVYVIRERLGENFSVINDLPPGISEKRYAQLPIPLQQALLDIDNATDLTIDGGSMPRWLPEIELLKNLTDLRIRAELRELPDGIAALTNLRMLDVTMNKLQTISPKISELKKLQSFSARFCGLSYFPAALMALPELKEIDLGWNDFTEIPPDIDRMKNLQTLKLESAKVTSFPDSMADMKQLYVHDGDSKTFRAQFPEKFQHLFIDKSKK